MFFFTSSIIISNNSVIYITIFEIVAKKSVRTTLSWELAGYVSKIISLSYYYISTYTFIPLWPQNYNFNIIIRCKIRFETGA